MIRAVGLVIYSYNNLEDYQEPVWDWIQKVEGWYGEPFAEFIFNPRNKRIGKVLQASPPKRNKLRNRMQNEMPWSLIYLGFPKSILSGYIADFPSGLVVSIVSYPKSSQGQEAYRHPSRLSIEVDPNIFRKPDKAAEFISLGSHAWSIIEGIYGFIDVDTGISPNDNLARNFGCAISNLIPQEHFPEFREWQSIQPVLNKKIWKIFWGNYLSQEHIQQIGGYADLRRADWYRPQEEIILESSKKGKLLLDKATENQVKLAKGGLFFQLSNSPLSWLQPETQIKRKNIQESLASISIKSFA